MEPGTTETVVPHALVVFDGECSFCNGWIDILLRLDRKNIFLFVASQSRAGASLASRMHIPLGGVDSILVIEGNRIRVRSDAVLHILRLLGLPFSLAGIFRLIPARLRDVVYDWIARNRTRWIGKATECRVPSASERHRFL